MIRVALCLCSTDFIHTDFCLALVHLDRVSWQAGIDVAIWNWRSALVQESRRKGAMSAMETHAEWLFWLDTDIIHPADTLTRLLAHGKDIVGATYPQRRPPHTVLGNSLDGTMIPATATGLYEMARLPFGCMLIHRRVFESLKQPWFSVPWLEDRQDTLSEDYAWADAAREAGFRIWCDLDLSHDLGHAGQAVYKWARPTVQVSGGTADTGAASRSEGERLLSAAESSPGSGYVDLRVDRTGRIQHYFDRIHGWFERDGQEIYAAAVKHFRHGASFVEVGAWKGRSAAFMGVEIANAHKLQHHSVVDHFAGSDEVVHRDDDVLRSGMLEAECRRNLEPVKDHVTVLAQPSTVAAEFFGEGTLDFVFLDGSHDQKSVLADIRAWLPKLKPDGVIGGDDIGWPGVLQAVSEMFGESPESDPPQMWHQRGRCWLVVPSLEAAQAFGLAPEGATSVVSVEAAE